MRSRNRCLVLLESGQGEMHVEGFIMDVQLWIISKILIMKVKTFLD